MKVLCVQTFREHKHNAKNKNDHDDQTSLYLTTVVLPIKTPKGLRNMTTFEVSLSLIVYFLFIAC